MIIVPYRKIIIHTRLQRAEAVKTLREAVFTHLPSIFYVPGAADYYATIQGDHFTAYRLSRHRNSFMAVLHGRFIRTPAGTDIQIKIYPPVIQIILWTLFIAAVSSFAFQSFYQWVFNGDKQGNVLGVLLIPILVYIAAIGLYSPEAQKAELFIQGVYEERPCA